MKYTACMGRDEIRNFSPPANSVAICIHDPNSMAPIIQTGYDDICYFQFWDLDKTIVMEMFEDEWDRDKGPRTREPATLTQLESIRAFIRKYWTKNIFVSCEAGISRSAAIREYLIFHKWNYYEDNERRDVSPNNYILRSLKRMDFEKWK